MNDSILIIGAGELGLAMIDAFAKKLKTNQGSLNVLLKKESIESSDKRKIQRLCDFEMNHIGVTTGDLEKDSIATLSGIFSKFGTIINCSGFVGGQGTQIKITKAVLNAQVPTYVPWQFGVDYDIVGKGSGQPVWDEQYDVRELLRSQNTTDWIIVSTGIFTSYLFSSDFGIVDLKEKIVHALGDWNYKITVTTPEDIGRLTAEIVFFVPKIKNEIVFVAGDTLSYEELANITEHVVDEPFKRELLSMSDLTKAIEKDENNVAAKYRIAFARPDGVAWEKTATFNFHHNIEVSDVKDWLMKSMR
ncbi:aromatic alcohol reductase [Sulfurospirillum halorespirans]|uniref:NAD(P)-dependent aromatic alcohol reductase n=1 Tax=Sulfurospirillum halorespirans DSM 13726 TaxID=1193502 RepID=A0A1D7TI57_9BACT|nr:aromatic alcohol reductase [Sulfurospirillum halorespirans]AOO64712.1 NAD(P)-dependent aromatic alcohol reductase [Sulfurospirillum halorespirans DSM 13726]